MDFFPAGLALPVSSPQAWQECLMMIQDFSLLLRTLAQYTGQCKPDYVIAVCDHEYVSLIMSS
jgi:hypothetical protein